MDALVAALAAEARLLPAAEGGGGVGDDADVEAHHPGLELVDHALTARERLGEDVGDEAVLGVVRQAHGVVFVVEGDDREHGSEDLLAEDVTAGLHVGHDGRLEERAGAVDGRSARGDGGAALDGIPHQGLGLVDGAVVDEGADLYALLGAAADLHALHALGDTSGELLDDAALHDEAVGRGARLADVAELREHRALDRLVEIGVVEHDEGGVAAELHRGAQHAGGGLLQQLHADRGGPGERELAQARVGDDALRDRAGVGGRHDVDDAGGEPGILQDLSEEQRRQRREGGRLDDHGAARGERRGDLAGGHGEGEVPRGDEVAGPHGVLRDDHAAGALGVGAVAALGVSGDLAEPAEELPAVADLAAGLGEGLAHLEGHQQRDVFLALLEQVERAAEDLGALTRRRGRPRRERLGRGIHRRHAVVDRRIGDLEQDVTGGGVVHGDGLAALGRAPFPVDQQTGGYGCQQLALARIGHVSSWIGAGCPAHSRQHAKRCRYTSCTRLREIRRQGHSAHRFRRPWLTTATYLMRSGRRLIAGGGLPPTEPDGSFRPSARRRRMRACTCTRPSS